MSRVLFLLLLLTGCVRMEEADDRQVKKLVDERALKEVSWAKGTRAPVVPEGALSCDDAVEVALFNNMRAQEQFARLGVLQADLTQAGLFRNPIFAGFVRFPVSNSSVVNSEVSFTQSFAELFLMPLRKKVARNELEKAELEVAAFLLNLIYDVKDSYYRLQAGLAKRALLEQLNELKALQFLLAERQYQAANIGPVEYMQKQEDAMDATLRLYKCQQEVQDARKALAVLLSVDAEDALWHVPGELKVPKATFEGRDLVRQAKELRLELLAARLDVKRFFDMGASKKWWAYTDPSAGISYERDSDKITVLGPTLSVALPFFDHGQADRARLIAYVEQSRAALKAKELEVMHEVEHAKASLTLAFDRFMLLDKTMLPIVNERLFVAKEYYDVMAYGLYSLLDAKERELMLQVEAVDAMHDYWSSYVALEKSVGGHIQ